MSSRHGSGQDLGWFGEAVYRFFYSRPDWLGFVMPPIVFVIVLQLGLLALKAISPRASMAHDIWAFWLIPLIAFVAALLVFEVALFAYWLKGDRWKLAHITESKPEFRTMSGRQFEDFVGGLYERQGYQVDYARQGADGGYDLVLNRDSERILVQCKQRATTGVAHVRELYGVLKSDRAKRALFVASGVFSYDARMFARGKPLELVDGTMLLHMGQAVGGPRPSISTASASSSPGHGGDV
jgi:restriction system protein